MSVREFPGYARLQVAITASGLSEAEYLARAVEAAKAEHASRLAADRRNGGRSAGTPGQSPETAAPADPLAALMSFRERQATVMPPRRWFDDGMITTGFNMITARKAFGKSFLMLQLADAIAEGRPILGRKTERARCLLVSFELDEGDLHERFAAWGTPLSEDAFLLYVWPSGEAAFAAVERAVREYNFSVIFFDTFLPLLPHDPDFKINEYGDSEYFLRWRLLGKRLGAAIVGSWHEGKSPREDFFLSPIGSSGMVGQADSLISIDRRRGDAAGKLFVGGNHAKNTVIPFLFENGLFKLAEGAPTLDRLTPDEERTLAVLAKHPEGCTPTAVGLATGKNDHAARMTLNRLIARGKVTKPARGVYALATLLEPH